MANFLPLNTILVKPAAALVPFSPYTLSNTTVGDVPTATICGVNTPTHIFVGKGPTAQSGAGVNYQPGDFYNATAGKKPEDAFVPGDTFAIILQGYPIATVRTTAAITEGVEVAVDAGGSFSAPAATDRLISGVTLGSQATAGGLVDILVQVRQNPLFVPT